MKLLLLSILFILASCLGQKNGHNLKGIYFSQGKGDYYSLSFQRHRTFSYVVKFFEVNSGCPGKWNHLSGDTIELHCDTVTDILTQLTQGYMNDRIKKALVVNKDTIKIDGVLLVRHK
jgi:hypothetical protein